MEHESISKLVEEVLKSDPAITKCLEMGIVNYSKLARRLKSVLSKTISRDISLESIKMALIRLQAKGGIFQPVSKEALSVIARSRVEVRTGVVIIIVGAGLLQKALSVASEISPKARYIAIMHSGMTATIVLDESSANTLLRLIDNQSVIEIQRDHAALVVISPPDITWVPGVVAYITNILANHGINILHIESCYTDTVMVVTKKDLIPAFNVLVKHIEIAKALLMGTEKHS
ncbi:MAG: ACT domain-containing protein [Desulfurococcaceae archaeon]